MDSGAWIALALTRDPMHDQARAIWERNVASGTRWATSVPVVIETFTFLSSTVHTDIALAWRASLREVEWLRVLECSNSDLDDAFEYFAIPDLHRLSAVDATSFVLMRREGLKLAFSFDVHFGVAGFRYLA